MRHNRPDTSGRFFICTCTVEKHPAALFANNSNMLYLRKDTKVVL